MASSYDDDTEARCTRMLDGFSFLIDVMQSQVPGLSVPSEQAGALLSILYDEVKAVVPCREPRHQPRGAND